MDKQNKILIFNHEESYQSELWLDTAFQSYLFRFSHKCIPSISVPQVLIKSVFDVIIPAPNGPAAISPSGRRIVLADKSSSLGQSDKSSSLGQSGWMDKGGLTTGRNLLSGPYPLTPPIPPPYPPVPTPPPSPFPPSPLPPTASVASVIVAYRIQGLTAAKRRQILQSAASLSASVVMGNIASGAAVGNTSKLFTALTSAGLNITSLLLLQQSIVGGVPAPPTPPPMAPQSPPSSTGISRLTEIFIYVGVSVACGEHHQVTETFSFYLLSILI